MSEVKQHQPQLKGPGARRELVQQASIAQLLLLTRLRARNRHDLSIDLLERAAEVISVTCHNWFSSARRQAVEEAAKAGDPPLSPSGPLKNKGSIAHRHH